jgi:hypothetical protein
MGLLDLVVGIVFLGPLSMGSRVQIPRNQFWTHLKQKFGPKSQAPPIIFLFSFGLNQLIFPPKWGAM